jgi:hypothetical protein
LWVWIVNCTKYKVGIRIRTRIRLPTLGRQASKKTT